jgi:hypothetical protein
VGVRAALVALAAAVAITGCGAPEELSERDGRMLALARERLDDAIDTEETLRTSKVEARRLRRQVRALVSEGSFESKRLDEFGIAKLGLLSDVVPSLVIVNERGSPRALDRAATAAFLRHAERDARRAMLRPARDQVEVIVETIADADAGEDTKIPAAGRMVGPFLRETERDVRPIWRSLAERLRDAREEL